MQLLLCRPQPPRVSDKEVRHRSVYIAVFVLRNALTLVEKRCLERLGSPESAVGRPAAAA
jgi:hypothetical protein